MTPTVVASRICLERTRISARRLVSSRWLSMARWKARACDALRLTVTVLPSCFHVH